LLSKAAVGPRRRIATKPTRSSAKRRLDSKAKHSMTKKLRTARPPLD
jgi:ribosome-associated protein